MMNSKTNRSDGSEASVVRLFSNHHGVLFFTKLFLQRSFAHLQNLRHFLFLLHGSVNVNSVPTPCVLTTLIFSPWAWMISLTIERPSPVPFLSFPLDGSLL